MNAADADEVSVALTRVRVAADAYVAAQRALTDNIRAAHAAGASARSIAAEAGLTHPTVAGLLANPEKATVRRRRASRDRGSAQQSAVTQDDV